MNDGTAQRWSASMSEPALDETERKSLAMRQQTTSGEMVEDQYLTLSP